MQYQVRGVATVSKTILGSKLLKGNYIKIIDTQGGAKVRLQLWVCETEFILVSLYLHHYIIFHMNSLLCPNLYYILPSSGGLWLDNTAKNSIQMNWLYFLLHHYKLAHPLPSPHQFLQRCKQLSEPVSPPLQTRISRGCQEPTCLACSPSVPKK